MAKPTRQINIAPVSEEESRKEALEEIQTALIDNKESVLSTIELLNNINKSGVTNLLNGLFSEGDKVLDVIVTEASKAENTNAIKNILLLMGTLGTLNIKELEPILLKVNNGVQRVSDDPEPDATTGYVDLFKKLKDPEVNRSLTLLIRFLEGMGEETESEERN